jgi:hypothetical protein
MSVRKNKDQFPTLSSEQIKKRKRHDDLLRAPISKTTMKLKSLYGMAPKIYNKLPKALKDISNMNLFKKRLFTLWIDKVTSVTEFLEDKL